jgi:hypothetical protein
MLWILFNERLLKLAFPNKVIRAIADAPITPNDRAFGISLGLSLCPQSRRFYMFFVC